MFDVSGEQLEIRKEKIEQSNQSMSVVHFICQRHCQDFMQHLWTSSLGATFYPGRKDITQTYTQQEKLHKFSSNIGQYRLVFY